MNIITRILEWLYTQMLSLHPQDFLVNFGTEMQAVFSERLADGSPINPRHTTGTIYYIHTKDGWVPYVKEFWIKTGFLTHWMKVFNLSGV